MGRMQINTEAMAILSQISGNGGFDKGFDNNLFIWCQSKKGFRSKAGNIQFFVVKIIWVSCIRTGP